MIRVLVCIFLMLNFSMALTSCSSPGTFDNFDEGPISDEDSAGLDDEGGEATEDEDGDTENDLEAELDKEDAEETVASEDTVEGKSAPEEELEEEIVAENKPVPPSNDDSVEEPIEELIEQKKSPISQTESTGKHQITDIRYVANSSGGTVVIEASSPITYQTRMNSATNQFVIELAGVVLPAQLQRPYRMSDFGTRIAGINAYQSKGSDTARIVVQLGATSVGEPMVQQEGNSLVVIPPTPAPVAQAPSASTEVASASRTPVRETALAARTLDEFLTGNQKFYGRPISLQVKDADVRDVVNFLAEESGANIVISDDVGGKISLKLRRVPWDQALVTVMRSKALGYVRQGNVLRISTLKALKEETEAANKIMEAQKAIVPSLVQVMAVSYANLEELVKNLQPFLSKEGKVIADNRTNTIVVTDKEDAVNRIAKLVKTLDVAPSQVSIESKIVEAQEDFDRFIGVNWSQMGVPQTISSSGGFEGAPIDLTLRTTSSSLSADFSRAQPFNMSLGLGVLDFFGDLSAALTLAERDSLAKVISAPRISTMNREKATIRQEGENVTVISSRNEQTSTVTKQSTRNPFKLELSVTPQITADGSVIMDMEVTREFLGAVVDNELQARPINKRFAKTKVLVRNGQTAVIGGIFTSDELDNNTGIPVLRNIPILGWLFKSRSFQRSKNELLVFMTPRILGVDQGTKTAAN